MTRNGVFVKPPNQKRKHAASKIELRKRLKHKFEQRRKKAVSRAKDTKEEFVTGEQHNDLGQYSCVIHVHGKSKGGKCHYEASHFKYIQHSTFFVTGREGKDTYALIDVNLSRAQFFDAKIDNGLPYYIDSINNPLMYFQPNAVQTGDTTGSGGIFPTVSNPSDWFCWVKGINEKIKLRNFGPVACVVTLTWKRSKKYTEDSPIDAHINDLVAAQSSQATAATQANTVASAGILVGYPTINTSTDVTQSNGYNQNKELSSPGSGAVCTTKTQFNLMPGVPLVGDCSKHRFKVLHMKSFALQPGDEIDVHAYLNICKMYQFSKWDDQLERFGPSTIFTEMFVQSSLINANVTNNISCPTTAPSKVSGTVVRTFHLGNGLIPAKMMKVIRIAPTIVSQPNAGAVSTNDLKPPSYEKFMNVVDVATDTVSAINDLI